MKRREFLMKSGMTVAGISLLSKQALAGITGQTAPAIPRIGAITYSFRTMDDSLESIISYCKTCGMSAIELMGDPVEKHLGAPQNPVDFRSLFSDGRRREMTAEEKAKSDQYRKDLAAWRETVSMKSVQKIRKMFDKAGIEIYAFKPGAFGEQNTDAEIEYGMKAGKVLGANSVTLELPTNSNQTARLGKLAEKHKIYVGYHAHTQATDTLWDEALAQSPYNSLNLDFGHYIAAGGSNTRESLMRLIENKHDRITSMHMKDRQTKENGGKNLPWGTGDTPICEVLTLLRDKGYDIPVSVELEYQIPEDSDAVQEVKKCVDYAKACLA